MFLKKLTIENQEATIREIPFHKGINVIIDETLTDRKQETGNNVGKTTVLKLVDFCLGGDGKSIYTDTEFNRNTQKSIVEDFLIATKVSVTLLLTTDVDNDEAPVITIKKNFLKRKEKIQEINGEQLNDADFDMKLKELVLKTEVKKPTFKQVVAKNVRYEKNRLINTIKVLHHFTSNAEYEVLYLFLLGIPVEILEEKNCCLQKIRTEERLQERLRESGSADQVDQYLEVVNRDIGRTERRKNEFGESKKGIDFESLNKLQSEMNKIASRIGRLEMRRSLIVESRQGLESESVEVNIEQIKSLYSGVKKFIPDLQVSFEQAVAFHKVMLNEKMSFITEELPAIEAELHDLQIRYLAINTDYNAINREIKSNQAYQELVLELNKSYERKGELSELKKLWDESNGKLIKLTNTLENINRAIKSEDELIKSNLKKFNSYFSDLSQKLYGESFVLSSDVEDGTYTFNVTNLEGSIGTGKKKGQIAAFDFAYIQFADAMDIPCLHFVMHDQIENVHDNQITSLLNDVVNETNCQFVIPVLKDKLPNNVDLSSKVILTLSQKDKLFKIEELGLSLPKGKPAS